MDKKQMIFRLKHNRVIRYCLKPIMSIRSLMDEKKFLKSTYPKKIKEYKNRYLGKRCFIIGNGPSLNPDDLNLIKDEISFGSNRIYHIFSKTVWRPTFYMSTDIDILRQEQENVKDLKLPVKFITFAAEKFLGVSDDIIYLFLKGPFELKRNKFVQVGVSSDVSKYSVKTQTVTCVSMELAMYMGFKEIYLIGVDHNFAKYVDSTGRLVEDNGIKNYFEGMKGDDSQAILYTDDTTACYEVVRKYAEENGTKIFNATRGGKLEVYPRVSLDRVLS